MQDTTALLVVPQHVLTDLLVHLLVLLQRVDLARAHQLQATAATIGLDQLKPNTCDGDTYKEDDDMIDDVLMVCGGSDILIGIMSG